MTSFRPLHDRVLVKRVEVEERTPHGVIIPDTAKEKPAEGEVLAIGPGARDEMGNVHPLDIEVGDHVVFAKSAGTELVIEGEDRLILKETQILGVLQGSPGAATKSRRRPPQSHSA